MHVFYFSLNQHSINKNTAASQLSPTIWNVKLILDYVCICDHVTMWPCRCTNVSTAKNDQESGTTDVSNTSLWFPTDWLYTLPTIELLTHKKGQLCVGCYNFFATNVQYYVEPSYTVKPVSKFYSGILSWNNFG